MWCWILLTTTWISHQYTYMLSLLNLPPNPHPIMEHWVELPVLYSSFPQAVYWKRPWCWERLKAGGEGDDRGWDGWMASLTQWTWVWANSGRWWRTGKPGVQQSMGLQRVGHNWTTITYTLMLLFQFIQPSPSLSVSTSPFSTSASLFMSCEQVHQCHFSRFHI